MRRLAWIAVACGGGNSPPPRPAPRPTIDAARAPLDAAAPPAARVYIEEDGVGLLALAPDGTTQPVPGFEHLGAVTQYGPYLIGKVSADLRDLAKGPVHVAPALVRAYQDGDAVGGDVIATDEPHDVLVQAGGNKTRIALPKGSCTSALAVAPDGGVVAAVLEPCVGTGLVGDLATIDEATDRLVTRTHLGDVIDLAFVDAATIVLARSGDTDFSFYDLRTGASRDLELPDPWVPASLALFASTAPLLPITDQAGDLAVFDTARGKVIGYPAGHDVIAVAPDASAIAVSAPCGIPGDLIVVSTHHAPDQLREPPDPDWCLNGPDDLRVPMTAAFTADGRLVYPDTPDDADHPRWQVYRDGDVVLTSPKPVRVFAEPHLSESSQ